MANPEHAEILKQGVEVWNKWRKENPVVRPDLSSMDLNGASLVGANLIGADFKRARLIKVSLIGANLWKADLREANLQEANLKVASLIGANLWKANLRGALLSRVDLRGANLKGAWLKAANLSGADFSWANLRGANLKGASLRRAYLKGADLIQANLNGTSLFGAMFWRANFRGALLKGANLRGANLIEANLIMADLDGANLSGASLKDADLRRANLIRVDLRRANLIRANLSKVGLNESDLDGAEIGLTTFSDVDLTSVRGLKTISHLGPSSIGIDTIYKSQGKIPEEFLRGCGVPDEMIEFSNSLFGKAIEFYSCFISYSTKNQAFANRLYADLQAVGVRCWFAPHDIQSGRKIDDQIDQAIRVYDKLLLILSTDSMNSGWVQREIKKATARERKEEKQMLFPIGLAEFSKILDWELFDADEGRDLAAEIREYYIPDFSNWKEHDSYKVAFERLLRDLKGETKAE